MTPNDLMPSAAFGVLWHRTMQADRFVFPGGLYMLRLLSFGRRSWPMDLWSTDDPAAPGRFGGPEEEAYVAVVGAHLSLHGASVDPRAARRPEELATFPDYPGWMVDGTVLWDRRGMNYEVAFQTGRWLRLEWYAGFDRRSLVLDLPSRSKATASAMNERGRRNAQALRDHFDRVLVALIPIQPAGGRVMKMGDTPGETV